MIYFKIHELEGEKLIAACDAEIMGKTFTDGEIEFEIDNRFYGKDLISADEFIALLEDATSANLMGSNVVDKSIDAGFVDKNSVMEIAGVKHAQIVVI